MPDPIPPEDVRRLTGLVTLGIIISMMTFVAIIVAVCFSVFAKTS